MSRVNTGSALDRGARPSEVRTPGFRPVEVAPVVENLGPVRSDAATFLQALQGLAGAAQAAAGLAETERRIKDRNRKEEEQTTVASLQLEIFDITDGNFADIYDKMETLDPDHQLTILRTVRTQQAHLRSLVTQERADVGHTRGEEDRARTELGRRLDNEAAGYIVGYRKAISNGEGSRVAVWKEGFEKWIDELPEEEQGGYRLQLQSLDERWQSTSETNAHNAAVDAADRAVGFIQEGINTVEAAGTYEEIYNKFEPGTTGEARAAVYQSFWEEKITDITRNGMLADGLDPKVVEAHLKEPAVENTIKRAANSQVADWVRRDDGKRSAELAKHQLRTALRINTRATALYRDAGKAPEPQWFIEQFSENKDQPGVDAIRLGQDAATQWYESVINKYARAADNDGVTEDWMVREGHIQSLIDGAKELGVTEDLQEQIARTTGIVSTRYLFHTAAANRAGTGMDDDEITMSAGLETIRRFVEEGIYSDLFVDLGESPDYRKIREIIFAGANDQSLGVDERRRFQRLHAFTTELESLMGTRGTPTGSRKELHDLSLNSVNTFGELGEQLTEYAKNPSLDEQAKQVIGFVMEELAGFSEFEELGNHPLGPVLKSTVEIFAKSQKLRNHLGTETDYNDMGNLLAEMMRDVVSADSEALDPLPNGTPQSTSSRMFDAGLAAWRRMSDTDQVRVGELVYQKYFGIDKPASPVDALLMARQIEQMFEAPVTPGVTREQSLRTFVERQAAAFSLNNTKSFEIKNMSVGDGIQGTRDILGTYLDMPAARVPNHAARLVSSYAMDIAKDKEKVTKTEILAGLDEFTKRHGFIRMDPQGIVSIVPVQSGDFFMGENSLKKRITRVNEMLDRAAQTPVFNWVAHQMYGQGDATEPLFNVINQYREITGKDPVNKDDPTFEVRLAMSNRDGLYRFMLEADIADEQVKDLIPLLSQDGTTDWVISDNQYHSFTKAVGLSQTLQQSQAQLRRLELKAAIAKRQLERAPLPVAEDCPDCDRRAVNISRLQKEVQDAELRVFNLKEWQTENLSTLKELVLTASDGTLDQLSQNSEQVSNQIDQWFNAERERLIEAQKKRMNTVPGRRFPGT